MNDNQTHYDSMKGKRVIITGPTSGFGKEIAIQLAKVDAELILACRDVQRGEQTAAEIAQRTGNQHCVVMHIDTSDQRSIREFAQAFRSRYSHLDVLINNAGVHQPQRRMNSDGIELTFATNVLGYFLLTQELLDTLKASRPARIVNVASTFASDLDLTDLQFDRRPYEGSKAYAQSKACDRMLTWALARRLEGSGITANAMAPGLVVGTDLYRDVKPAIRLLLRIVSLFKGRSVAQGADTTIWLASNPDIGAVNGTFFDQRQVVPCKFRNDEAEEQLWRICEQLARPR